MGGKIRDFFDKVGEWLTSRSYHVTPIWPEAYVTTAQMAVVQQQAARDNMLTGMQTALGGNVFAENCTIDGLPMAKEPDIATVLIRLGEEALLAALPPTLRNITWIEDQDRPAFNCTITAKHGDLPSIPVWSVTRCESPYQNVYNGLQLGRMVTYPPNTYGADWAQPFIDSALEALRQQYAVLVLKEEEEMNAAKEREAQEHVAAVESYKIIIAREYAASLGDLLVPGEDMPAIVNKMEEMFVAVADESSKAVV
jgi:hypothetical protein